MTTDLIVDWFLAWLWQGSLLVLLVTGALKLIPRTSAATRYLAWWATMLAVCALPAWTWPSLPGPAAVGVTLVDQVTATAAMARLAPPTPLALPLPDVADWLVALIIVAWIGAAAIRLAGVARAIVALTRLKQRCRKFPPDREARLNAWMSIGTAGRRTQLRVCDQVSVSSVLGLRHPVIAVPSSFLRELTDAELDQIVLHELAHVRRWDDWGRLAQVLAVTLAGCHPAVWWISRHLQIEREIACDDWVISQSGAPRAYASCLTKVAAVAMWRGARGITPGAIRSAKEISTRVGQILDGRRTIRRRGSRAALGGWMLLLAAAIAVLTALPPVVVVDRAISALPAVPRVAMVGAAPAGLPLPRPTIEAVAMAPRLATPRPPQPYLMAAEAPRLLSSVSFDWTPRTAMPSPSAASPPARERAAVTAALWPADRWRGRDNVPSVGPLIFSDQPEAAAHERSAWRVFTRAGTAVGSGVAKAGVSTAKAFTGLGATVARAFRRDD